jgi:hypothetical protein
MYVELGQSVELQALLRLTEFRDQGTFWETLVGPLFAVAPQNLVHAIGQLAYSVRSDGSATVGPLGTDGGKTEGFKVSYRAGTKDEPREQDLKSEYFIKAPFYEVYREEGYEFDCYLVARMIGGVLKLKFLIRNLDDVGRQAREHLTAYLKAQVPAGWQVYLANYGQIGFSDVGAERPE